MFHPSDINLQSIFEHLPCYVYLRDLENHIIGGNIKTLQLAGAKKIEALECLSDFDAPWCEYSDNYIKHDKDTLSGLHYRQLDPVMSADGFKVLMAEKTALFNEKGKFSAILGIGIEITDSDILSFVNHVHKQVPLNEKRSIVISDENYLDSKLNSINLSKRESECLFYTLHGYTVKMIAKVLKISPRTAEGYIDNLKNKLGCNNKKELIELSIELGIFHFVPESLVKNKILKFFEANKYTKA
jgi:DNA-binding CsgD family transcriptional regulator